MFAIRLMADEQQAGNRSNTGQSFSPKSQTGDFVQILLTGNFTGGVACQRKRQLFRRNTRTVVGYAHQF